MNSIESLQNKGKGAAVTRKHGYKINTASNDAQHAAEEMMLQIENDMKDASAKLAAEQAGRMVKGSIRASMERIDSENENMRNWEENMVRRSGYHVDGKNIHRDAVVDSTIGKTYYEGQSVHYYEDFYNAGPTISVSLSKTMLDGLNSSAIMLLVEQANYDIENWSKQVFGNTEKDEDGNVVLKQIALVRDSFYNDDVDRFKTLSKKDYDKLSEDEQKEFNDLSTGIVSIRDGALGEWIGYAPVFKDGNSGLDLSNSRESNIKYQGSGQMGKIMLDFQWNNMIEQQGWQKVALPAYDQPLWRGNGSWFEPPTIKGISSIVFEVVGTASGQKWFSYADDLIFAAIDVGGGFKSAEQVGLDLAKTAATAALSAGIGAAGNALSSSVSAAMDGAGKGWDFLAQSTISMTQSYVSTVGNSAINSVYINSDGTLDFNKEGFVDSLHSAGTISSVVGAGITGGLNGVYATDSNGIALNGRTFNTNGIHAMTGLAGGLATNAVSLAMGGDATFNIASAYGVGLLEFSVGKNGVHSKFGMGGTNISYQNLKAAYGGLSEAKKVADWKYNLGEEKKRTLNAINMLGYTNAGNNQQLAGEIWNGTKNVEYRNLDGEYGHFNTCEDPNKVILSDALLGKGKEASAMLATVMSHEGTHVYGNRVEGVAHAVGFSTYGQLMNQFGIKGNDTMLDSMMDAYFDKSSWTENSGDVDYWRLAKKADSSYGWAEDGSLEFNISRTDLEELARKDIKEAILLLGSAGANFYNGKSDTFKLASSENMTIDVAYKLAGLVGIKDTAYKGLPWETPQYEYDMAQLDFARNTLLFADASNAAKKAIALIDDINPNATEINSYLTQLKNSLYAAQKSGLLVKNPYGAIDTTGLVETNGSFVPVQLGPNQKVHDISTLSGLRMLYSEKEKKFQDTIFHTGIDLRGIWDSNIVSGNDSSSFSLTYSDTFGLRGINSYSDYDNTDLLSHMEASPTIKAYISNFGKEGVSIDSQGNLDGIKKGTVLGNVGNTGNRSNGEHLDWIVQETNSKGKKENISPLSSNLFGDYLATSTRTYEATTITGLPFDYDMKSEDAYDKVKSYYNWAYTKEKSELDYAQKLLNSYTTKYADEIWKRNLQNGVPGYYSKQK